MIGLGWATLYATIIETYEKKKPNLKIQSELYSSVNK